ncbi:MAG: hypothetical protein LBU32_03430 [Clostridiales bacterium]|nr:hypothetical protein [Clostridiales bacterium]
MKISINPGQTREACRLAYRKDACCLNGMDLRNNPLTISFGNQAET